MTYREIGHGKQVKIDSMLVSDIFSDTYTTDKGVRAYLQRLHGDLEGFFQISFEVWNIPKYNIPGKYERVSILMDRYGNVYERRERDREGNILVSQKFPVMADARRTPPTNPQKRESAPGSVSRATPTENVYPTPSQPPVGEETPALVPHAAAFIFEPSAPQQFFTSPHTSFRDMTQLQFASMTPLQDRLGRQKPPTHAVMTQPRVKN